MARWREESEVVALLAVGAAHKQSHDNSGFLFGMPARTEFSLVLQGLIEYRSEIPASVRESIANKVADGFARGRLDSPRELLMRVRQLESEYLKQPEVAYRLLTEISIGPRLVIPRTRIGPATVTFAPRSIAGFDARARVYEDVKSSLGFELPAGYMPLCVRISARSFEEAAETALDWLDVLRALWNLTLNRLKAWRHSSGVPQPVNDIRLSPFHTLHTMDGEVVPGIWWYEPQYGRSNSPVFADATRMARVLEGGDRWRRFLQGHRYLEEVRSALLRYVRALDSSNLTDSFLRLWGLLEFLTDGTRESHRIVARRAAFHFSDRARASAVLTHLSTVRNRFVHAGKDDDEIEASLYLLKRHVEKLLTFHVTNPFSFSSRAEAARFMDLPTGHREIDNEIERLKKARRYGNPR